MSGHEASDGLLGGGFCFVAKMKESHKCSADLQENDIAIKRQFLRP